MNIARAAYSISKMALQSARIDLWEEYIKRNQSVTKYLLYRVESLSE